MSDPKPTGAANAGQKSQSGADKVQEAPFPLVEFTAEFSGPNNEKISWPLNQRVFRGGWKGDVVRKLGGSEEAGKLPDVPGFVLAFNSAKRQYVIYDPLSRERNKAVNKAISDKITAAIGYKMGPEDESWHSNMTPNQMKTAIYLARRLLDNSQLIVHTGSIPEISEIDAMPGVIEFTSSHLDQNMEGVKILSLRGYKSPKDTNPKGMPEISLEFEVPTN